MGADSLPSVAAVGRRGGWWGVVRSTASLGAKGAFGVEGAWWPSATISMVSSPYRGLWGLVEGSE